MPTEVWEARGPIIFRGKRCRARKSCVKEGHESEKEGNEAGNTVE
jgi:hypothetical protein